MADIGTLTNHSFRIRYGRDYRPDSSDGANYGQVKKDVWGKVYKRYGANFDYKTNTNLADWIKIQRIIKGMVEDVKGAYQRASS